MYKNYIWGYKCFNEYMLCNYDNFKMEPNKLYKVNEDIKFRKKGFHFCLRLEDTLRYFGEIDDKKEICKIIALGDIDWYNDYYNEYFDMGCTNVIYIGNVMSRGEIINYIDQVSDCRFIRFIMGYRLSNEELLYFKNKYRNNNYVMNNIRYYQDGDKEIFNKQYSRVLKK